jgi:peptide/nickel transport system substrate-binding protein
MKMFYSGDPAVDIAQKSNKWAGRNYVRWINADYNKIFDQVRAETDPQKAQELWMQLNDVAVNAYISVPLIDRKSTNAKVKGIQGPNLSPFDTWSWNIADWTRA